MRRRKEAGEPKPWSEDKVFQATYFTNVHREDDKVTKWIRKYFTVPTYGPHLEVALVAARVFNWPGSLSKILDILGPYQPEVLRERLLEMQDKKQQIWGGAYLITTHGMKMTKVDYCVNLLKEASRSLPFYEQDVPMEWTPTCQEYHHHLMTIDGLGSFLAAQVVADLKHTPDHPLTHAEDWWTFSAPGPGSLRGLAWFMGLDKVSPTMYDTYIQEVKNHLNWQGDMQDLQNCLCEFDKYCRVSSGTGRSKRKYPGF